MLYIVGAVVLIVGLIIGNSIVKIVGIAILVITLVLHILARLIHRSQAKEEPWRQKPVGESFTSYAPPDPASSSSSISADKPTIDFSKFGRFR